ncbi:MAG: acyl carrier protein [Candidatus Hydrogenedentes bacterium]|nr:acyl carrier protein [Candidatus Hydrogenedentota bacterium]
MGRSSAELDRLVLEVAERVMRQRGIQRLPSLDLPVTEEGLGLDSMGRLELLQALEETAKVSIPEIYWDGRKLKTLRETAKLLAHLGA